MAAIFGIAFWSNLPGMGVGREVAARQRVVKQRPTAADLVHAQTRACRAATSPCEAVRSGQTRLLALLSAATLTVSKLDQIPGQMEEFRRT